MLKFFMLIFFCATSVLAENDLTVETKAGTKWTGYLGIKNLENMPYDGLKTVYEIFPESFDWRTASGVVSPIRDQGSCGSCWSFAITASLESAAVIQSQKPLFDLSEQHMVSCNKNAAGCQGGYMDSADYVVSRGLTDEATFPYTGRNSRCLARAEVVSKATHFSLLGTASSSPSIEEIKTALIDYGPLFVTVLAGGRGWSGATGEVTSCRKRGITNHMVNIVGYDSRGWIVRNSWGKEWGDNGYTHIKFGCDKIAEEAGYITTTKVY